MDLQVEIMEQDEETAVLAAAGEVDAYTAPKLKEALLPLTKKENFLVKVDLKDVSYMDSTGLGVFISALKSTKENNSSMKLVHLQDRVLRLFEITGLIEIMDIEWGANG
ncbi:STAS domain-containing protein [Virgibacillus sp. 179-BFC.A HS]|uniref:Anti-sigma factor antagonist n=1 Tax=Tigheibacillus jepli TaxID=3035914 RepID=A0ABU5CKK0_9BACI|nr:STAS domain-containing protein [Virgibacillus sp. 179-BFC.A HS]MDY0406892.1 STAS domain-containing protein [Virgibacillus sp. 179-BFC.A HS]